METKFMVEFLYKNMSVTLRTYLNHFALRGALAANHILKSRFIERSRTRKTTHFHI